MPESESFKTLLLGGTTWRVRSDAANDLLPWLKQGVESLIPNAVVLKDRFYRAIYSLTIPDTQRQVILKHFRNRHFGDVIKRSFVDSTAMREWRNAYALAHAGLPTPLPLAVGHRKRGPFVVDSWLIVEMLPNVRTLHDLLASNLKLSDRKRLLQKSADLVRALHDAGFKHPDLHSRNILVTDADAEPHLWIIDLHAIVRDRMPEFARCDDLARLDSSLPLSCASRSDRLRFFKMYWKGRTHSGAHFRRMLKLTARLSMNALWSRCYRRAVRCVYDRKLFGIERTPFGKVYRARDCDTEAIREIIARHRACLQGGEGEIRKNDRNAKVTLVADPRGVGRVCVKEYCSRGILHRAKDLIRHPPALREWFAAHMLAVRNMPSVDAIAAVLPPRFRLRQSCYFISKEVAGAVPLREYAVQVVPGANRENLLQFIREAADFLASTHKQRVIHFDLKASNILVVESNEARSFVLVDLGKMGFHAPSNLRIAKCLAQLHASLPLSITMTDRLRFLKRYLQKMGMTAQLREIAAEVAQQTANRRTAW